MKLKDGPIEPFTVNDLKDLLNQMPEDAEVSYKLGGDLVWDEKDNTLYVTEV